MDICTTLAATGSNYNLVGIVGLCLVIGAVVLMKRKGVRVRYMASVAAFVLSPLIPVYNSYAAPVECAVSQADTSTGQIGARQVYNVLANDQPTPGATFIRSSLRLALVDDPVPGSTLSSDEKEVTAPGEGTYVANDDGTITFTPEAQFVGRAKGVRYLVKDTADNTASNFYRPIVTAGTPVAGCSAIDQNVVLQDRSLPYVRTNNTDNTVNLANEAVIPSTTYVSRNGQNIIYSQKDKLMYSTDRGASWQRSAQDATGIVAFAGSADGSTIITAMESGLNMLVSRDYGASWTELPDSVFGADRIVMSANGQVVYATGNGYIYQSLDSGASWSVLEAYIGVDLYDIDTSADGMKVIAVGWPGLIVTSSDRGATWQTRDNPGAIASTQAPYVTDINDAGTQMLVTSNGVGKLFASTNDGLSWTERTDGTDRSLVAASAAGTGILAIDASGNYAASSNGGYAWTPRAVSDSNDYFKKSFSDDFSVVATHTDNTVVVSTSGGSSWTVFTYVGQIDPVYIDVDTVTPGLQRTIDRSATEGWTGSYDPATDVFTVTVTDSALFTSKSTYTLSYSLWVDGCAQPTPGVIHITPYVDIEVG